MLTSALRLAMVASMTFNRCECSASVLRVSTRNSRISSRNSTIVFRVRSTKHSVFRRHCTPPYRRLTRARQGRVCDLSSGRKLRPHFGEQLFGLASPDPGDVVLILEQRAERVVDG